METKGRATLLTWVSTLVFGLVAVSCVMDNRTPRLAGRELIKEQGVNIVDIAERKTRTRQAYGNLPLHFEANHGQTDAEVKLLARGPGYTLFLTASEAVMVLSKAKEEQSAISRQLRPSQDSKLKTQNYSETVLRMKLVGANPEPKVDGLDPLPGKANYFIGNDRTKWRSNIPTYARVRYQNVYPGIDLVYYGNQRQLEHDFIVAPGANPKTIKLAFEGAEKIETDSNGDLILKTGGGDVRLRKPYIYQLVNGVKHPIPGSYLLPELETRN